MNVKELMESLSKMPQDAEVYFGVDDDGYEEVHCTHGVKVDNDGDVIIE